MRGRLLWVLHAHLPLVRHPEHPRFFEEDWLFEALETVYLPLLDVLEGWARDGVDARLTLSISPTLSFMWRDPLLRARFRAYLDRASALRHEERARLRGGPLEAMAEAEAERLARARRAYERGGGLVERLRRLADAGVVELATTALTHPLLPAFASAPRFLDRQLRVALAEHARAFGAPPTALWLPECAWFEGADRLLADAGVRATFLEAHGLAWGRPPARCGVDRPAITPRGVVLFGRDPEVARAVWSSEVGYPGDPRFLDFHQDRTGALSEAEVQPFLLPTGARIPLRLRYWRVTDRAGGPKAPYALADAAKAAEGCAEAFLREQIPTLEARGAHMGWPAIIVAPFDAELFGHWWREGPLFLDALARRSAGRLTWTTPTRELARGEPLELLEPAPSSWGAGGDLSVWLTEATGPLWRRLLDQVADAEARPPSSSGALGRVRAQLDRQLALAAASDWTFLMRMGTAESYARRRIEAHLEHAAALADMERRGRADRRRLAALEAAHPFG